MSCRFSPLSLSCIPALLVSLVAGCAEPPVVRVVPLKPQQHLPRMDSLLLNGRLRLVLKELEPLREGTLFAWARFAQGLNALGAVEEISTFTVMDGHQVEELLVTHEASAAPPSPSGNLIFRGRLGETLALGGYGGPSPTSLSRAQVTARVQDEQLVLRSTELPSLGSGLHYAVWVRHQGSAGRRLGSLGSTGRDEFHAGTLLADFDEVLLTVELDAGVEAAGTELMLGQMLTSEGAAVQPEGPAHEH